MIVEIMYGSRSKINKLRTYDAKTVSCILANQSHADSSDEVCVSVGTIG